MSPLELIEVGFNTKDWGAIAQAYQMLTGKELTETPEQPTPKKRGRPKKVVAAVEEPAPKYARKLSARRTINATPEEFYGRSIGKTKLDLVDERPNWFETSQYNSVKDRGDEVFRKKVYKTRRALPKPPTVEKKKYTCRKCGHSDLLYPSQVVVGQFSSKGYYCNTCCGSH